MELIFIGDSLVEFHNWQASFPGYRVYNYGRAGETVEGLLSRVMNIKQLCLNADMIFIMSGINNIAMGDIGFIDFYRVIVEKLREAYPEAQIYIHSILPTLIDLIPDQLIKNVNRRLEELSKSSGVNYIDLYSRFTDRDGSPIRELFLEDGVHLSEKGYELWTEVIEEIIIDNSNSVL
jgi:lysophospholipase L1-like esterase